MAQIEIDRLGKSFKTNRILDDVSLAVETGEIVVVFGPSGTGKTVLLRLIAGVEDPDFGSIRLQGKDVTEAPPEARGIGMAFQNFALFPHMSAYDNVASALTSRSGTAAEIKSKVAKVAELLKIGHVMHHQPRELSNGQKQRTALARALVSEPRVLLLDDPLRNVDAKLRYEMRLELPSLLKRSGSTVLYVTQDYREAMALGDRIAVLLDGGFAQVATPAEIYRAPASVGVARLFGDPTLNLVTTVPVRENGIVCFGLGGAALALPAGYDVLVGAGTVVGIRPEALAVSSTRVPGGFPVEIMAVMPLNEKSVLLLRTAEGQELLAAESGETAEVRRHGPAFASFDPAALLVFDEATGKRVAPAVN
jgi:multiple sugar transport system ATP-binding protein